MPTITIPIKRIRYVDKTTNIACPFILEDLTCTVDTNNQLKYTLICGLTPTPATRNMPTIATRYVASNNTSIPLRGDELSAKKKFEAQRGLTRATSVYYRICECPLLAKYTFTVDPNLKGFLAISSSHLVVYTTPKIIPEGNSLTCNSMQLSPPMIEPIIYFIKQALIARHIIHWGTDININTQTRKVV